MTETDRLRLENQLMKKLGTREGFYQYYFEQLPLHRTQTECFNHCNDTYFELYGEYKYESYNSFRQLVSYYHNKRNK